jgi:hypothetical protein
MAAPAAIAPTGRANGGKYTHNPMMVIVRVPRVSATQLTVLASRTGSASDFTKTGINYRI